MKSEKKKKLLLVLKQSELANFTESELRKITLMYHQLNNLAPTPLPCSWLLRGKWVDAAPDVSKEVADFFARVETNQLVWSFGKTRS